MAADADQLNPGYAIAGTPETSEDSSSGDSLDDGMDDGAEHGDDFDLAEIGIDVPAEHQAGYQSIARTLSQSGVAHESLAPALAWMADAMDYAPSEGGQIARTDRYVNIDGAGFQNHELPGLASFLNAMHAARVPEGDVARMIEWFQQQGAKSARHGVEQRSTPTYRGHGDQRRAQIEKIMREDRKRYNRDEGLQAEYRGLLTGSRA